MKKIVVAALVGMGIVIFCAFAQADTFAWLFSQDPQLQKLGDQNITVAYRDCSQETDCCDRCDCVAANCLGRCGNDNDCRSNCADNQMSCYNGCGGCGNCNDCHSE